MSYDHAVFVSYATVDDRPAKCGWVSAFVNNLNESLAAAFGLRDPSRIWWDRSNIDEEASLTDQIRTKVQQSACMVAILSRGYSKSKWCRQEREAFLAAMAGQPDAHRRLFLIDIGNLDQRDRPPEFSDKRGRYFYVQPPNTTDIADRQPLGFPTPDPQNKDHMAFFAHIDQLAKDLYERVSKLPGFTPVVPPIKPNSDVTLFVAEAADDVAEEREEVVRFLSDHFRVLPAIDDPLPNRWDPWQASVDAALDASTLFVQVLGTLPGRKIAGSDQKLVIAQYEKAQTAPLSNLAKSLMRSGVLNDRWSNTPEGIALLMAQLRRSDVSLVNLIQQVGLPKYTNLLVLVDQFEEIFRFQQQDPNEALAFVSLLLETGRDRSVPIYVVLTMRTDFLGQCALFPGLPEALNDAQYLCPRLSRVQLAEAIEGPASVFETSVEPLLITQLVNDAGANSDQLPLVQHVLARMWHLNFGDAYGTGAGRTERVLRLQDYQKTGGLNGYLTAAPGTQREPDDDPTNRRSFGVGPGYSSRQNALSAHADEAYLTLGDSQHESRISGAAHQPSRLQMIAQMLFCCLAERGPSGQYVRRPMKLQDVADIAGCTVPELANVVNVFRRDNRCFLTPAKPRDAQEDDASDLNAGSVLDISHEALIRQWLRFGGQSEQSVEQDSSQSWLTAEDLCRRRYRRLVEAADSEPTAGLLRDPELGFLNKWWSEFQPREAWGNACVKVSYERTQQFLQRSLTQAANEAREKVRERQAKVKAAEAAALREADEIAQREKEEYRRRGLMILVVVSALGLVIAVALAVTAYNQRQLAINAKNEAITALENERKALDLKLIAEAETKREAIEAEKQRNRAEGYKKAYLENPGTPWPKGTTLHARFLDGSPELQAKVQKYALEWTEYANLRFEFGSSPDAEIRISFKANSSWAYVGTRVLSTPNEGPTVNLGFITDNTSDGEISRFVLHEFGHVLGMIHEFQNSNAKIPWNEEAVYDYFSKPPNLWPREVIDSMILQQYSLESVPHYKDKPYDPNSIMMYSFPEFLTNDGTVLHQGISLSEGDKEFARKLYPK